MWDLTRREDQICQAAVQLFAKRGFHGTSLRELATATKLNTGSIYYHISSKHELLHLVMVRGTTILLKHIEARVAEVADSDPLTKLRVALHAHVERHMNLPQETMVMDREISALLPEHQAEVIGLRDRYERLFRTFISEANAQGLIGPLDPAEVKVVTAAMLTAGASTAFWTKSGGPLSADGVASILERLFVGGLLSWVDLAQPTGRQLVHLGLSRGQNWRLTVL